MLQKIKIGIWSLEVDIEKTSDFYRQYHDKCDCSFCNNYAEACKDLDKEVKKFFHTLGIDAAKPWNLSDFVTENKGVFEYIGSYYLTGRMLVGELVSTSNWQESNTFNIKNFTFAFSEDLEFVPEGLDNPILQLDAVSFMPWVLDENGCDI